ncbi:MAG: 30S ribosomal protein S11 [Clostridiales Family XIII bacterium]|jgi:small subunit ribosomal protein S11|nr:30S ribosomal protein S11 [Clostridiales Family XIII bacterium]
MAVNKKQGSKNKKKAKKNVSKGQAHVQSTYNNAIITITDRDGNTISWASAGGLGFKGARKSTPYAAQQAAKTAGDVAVSKGMQTVDVFVKGAGAGKDSAIRALAQSGLKISMMKDVTPVPHNGCRPPKRRRV